jgi:uncharacterized cupredoxin-like copper-binding protein
MFDVFTEREAATMSTTVPDEHEHAPATLEDELHDIEEHEEALEQRTQSLEIFGPLTLLLSVFALAVAIGALVVAIGNKNSGSEAPAAREPPSSLAASSGGAASAGGAAGGGAAIRPSSSGAPMTMNSAHSGTGMMMGVGGHGSFTSSEVAAAGHGKVYVQLGDYWAAPTVRSVNAGKVTFVAKNVGRVPHELMVERMPIKMDGPMQPNEHAAQGMIDDMMAGQSGHMTVRLGPGTYMLFCNAPGHYALGQHTIFKVTKS